MKKIKILYRTGRTVTISVRDFEALLLAAAPKKSSPRLSVFRVAETKRMRTGVSPIRILRERRGLSQRAVADAAGISASYLTEIEIGAKPGSVAALRKVAEVLGVPIESLLPPA
ncbi:MAG TPA: helix-turn-helix transcriptional regulator [Stellaceae bacterium]|jgi:DNA-binding XRE family transcriptional regulator